MRYPFWALLPLAACSTSPTAPAVVVHLTSVAISTVRDSTCHAVFFARVTPSAPVRYTVSLGRDTLSSIFTDSVRLVVGHTDTLTLAWNLRQVDPAQKLDAEDQGALVTVHC